MEFIFKAKDAEGKEREGRVSALSREAAINSLQSQGLIPTSIIEEREKSQVAKDIKGIFQGVNTKELVIFFRSLATLIDAKVPIVSSLRAIEVQTQNKYLKSAIKEVADSVEDGMPFSEAAAKYPDIFPPLAVNMIKAGEVSGNLHRSINFIAENTEKNYQLTSKVKGALFYPVFVMAVAGVIGIVVVSFILPKLTAMIKDLNVEIPWYTKLMMGLGDFMQVYWWAVSVAILGLVGIFMYYIKSESGKREWDKIKIQLPVVGDLFRSIYLARFATNLSILLNGGLPIVRSLQIVSLVIGNHVFARIVARSAEEVQGGGQINTIFSRSADIPPIVAQMVRIGEESGKLSEILKSVAGFYDQEVENMTRNMSALIEPILIVFLGIGVLVLVLSVLMPIYSITSAF